MTGEGHRIQMPAWMIILDLFGTLLFALGIYGQFGGEELLLAEFLDLRQYAIMFILIGLFLMMPLVVNLINQVISQDEI